MTEMLIKYGTEWVKQLREQCRPMGRVLSDAERKAMASYFDGRILDKVRFHTLPIIPNPSFYSLLPPGTLIPIDFRQMAGLTVGDTVLLAESRIDPNVSRLPLIFHELVHVVQYDLIGTDEFIKQYVTGWATSGKQYMAIPMEQEAYGLQDRFAQGNPGTFAVASIVSRRLGGSYA